jgi:hypothetical protein
MSALEASLLRIAAFMDSLFHKPLIVLAIVLSGCNRNSAPQTQPAPPPAPAVTAAPAAPTPPPAAIPASTELPLNSVNSVMLSRPVDAPMALVVHVSGSAVSTGWTDPKLVENTDNAGDPAIKTYRLVATSPAMPDENRTTESLEAEIRVESLPPEVKSIRIVSATNDISAPIAQ